MIVANLRSEKLKTRFIAACFLLAPSSVSAEIYRCTEWTNSSLSHKGEVIVSIDENELSWRTDRASSTAQSVRQGGSFAAYVDDAFVYLVFGDLIFESHLSQWPIMIRRIPFVRQNPRIGEIDCH